jgi:Fe-S-cluster containining protein
MAESPTFRIQTDDLQSEEQIAVQVDTIAQHWLDTFTTMDNLLSRLWAGLDRPRTVDEQGQEVSEPIACHAGCYWCCYLRVELTEPELDVLRRWIKNQPFGRQIELRLRIQELAKGDLDPYSRGVRKIPCPFLDLESKQCTIYPIRPTTCRGHHSTSVRACKNDFNNQGNTVLQHQVGERIIARALLVRAFIKVIETKGQSGEWREMVEGLKERMT